MTRLLRVLSKMLTFLFAQTRLLDDRADHRNRNVTGMLRNGDTPPSVCTYRAWLPRCRRKTNPVFSSLRMISRARSGLGGMVGEIHAKVKSFLLLLLHGEWFPLLVQTVQVEGQHRA